MAAKLKITLIKSPIGAIPKHRATVKALGFHKLYSTLEKPDNEAIRGMCQAIRHMVKVEEIPE
ncbi:MAG: 50S ribosomal protein L30 [Lachnospiraceae bacterium]|nr:50S ribosomal protein L30 [Lachnospiraceae bacterium]